jgi:hypothetical protein
MSNARERAVHVTTHMAIFLVIAGCCAPIIVNTALAQSPAMYVQETAMVWEYLHSACVVCFLKDTLARLCQAALVYSL